MHKFKLLLLACIAPAILCATNTFAATTGNTIVRFQIRHGQVIWGNVDVELFDSTKPITVSNFLYYVRSGAFDRSILHRVVPGFIVQGGQYAIQNPYVDSAANYLTRIPEGPSIPSEATNTPVIPNTFGTLAMALSTSGSNSTPDVSSATTSWFFNTTDNTTDLPEYTVFGKVKGGSKFLKYFNTIGEDNGLINMFSLNYLFSTCDLLTIDSETDVGLATLPVFYFYFDCPYYSDLFNVQISIIKSTEDGADSVAPKIKITYPTPSTVITSDSITVTGTAIETVALDSVRVYIGSNPPVAATIAGTTWSAPLASVAAGTNTILVEATDGAGNRVTATSRFFFQVPWPITIPDPAGNGRGRTSGVTNGQQLDIGRLYKITATPDPGNVFMGWLSAPDTYVSFDQDYTFSILTNLTTDFVLYAQFDTNQFPYVEGTYNGLFVNAITAERQSSGSITLTLNDKGAYSAKMLINGYTIPFTGAFNTRGTNSATFFDKPGFPGFTRVNMGIDLISPDNQIRGFVTNFTTYSISNLVATNLVFTNLTVTNIVETNITVTTFVTNLWTADLVLDRMVFNAKTNSAPQAGIYTVIFPSDSSSPSGPAGDGYGTVTLSTAGAIKFAGVLPDGTKVVQKATLSGDGHWPLYVPLYKTNGLLVSWINFSRQPTTDFSGLFNWFNQAHPSKYFAGGFTNEATALGSRFTKPDATNQLLYLTNATVGFTNGNLAADFANSVVIDPKGKVVNQDANTLTFGISSGNGLFTGSATPPAGGTPIKFKGAILQKGTNASGFFLGTNASGRVYLGP